MAAIKGHSRSNGVGETRMMRETMTGTSVSLLLVRHLIALVTDMTDDVPETGLVGRKCDNRIERALNCSPLLHTRKNRSDRLNNE